MRFGENGSGRRTFVREVRRPRPAVASMPQAARRAREGPWSASQQGRGSVSAPGVVRDTRPGASLRRVRMRPTSRPEAVLRDDAAPHRFRPGLRARLLFCCRAAVREAAIGSGGDGRFGLGGGRRTGSPRDGDPGAESPARKGTGVKKGVSGHPDCPRFNWRSTSSRTRLGGTIPAAPVVSTGKRVTPRCQ